MPGTLGDVRKICEIGERGKVQPVNNFVVREAEDELVDHAVDAYCSTDELELRVFGVIEDEMMAVEVCQCFSADSACHLSFC
jgi:hypothetical protein